MLTELGGSGRFAIGALIGAAVAALTVNGMSAPQPEAQHPVGVVVVKGSDQPTRPIPSTTTTTTTSSSTTTSATTTTTSSTTTTTTTTEPTTTTVAVTTTTTTPQPTTTVPTTTTTTKKPCGILIC